METVTIPHEEYDALRSAAETLANMQSYDAAKAALARGEDELVPEPSPRALLTEKAPLTVFRELRGLSKIALGKASGIHRVPDRRHRDWARKRLYRDRNGTRAGLGGNGRGCGAFPLTPAEAKSREGPLASSIFSKATAIPSPLDRLP